MTVFVPVAVEDIKRGDIIRVESTTSFKPHIAHEGLVVYQAEERRIELGFFAPLLSAFESLGYNFFRAERE